MTLVEVVEKLGLRVLTGQGIAPVEVRGGYTSDLLSDVMGHARSGELWITLQTHPNVIAVAKLKDLAGIIFISNRRPDEETMRKAKEEGICLFLTDESAFAVSGRLYELLEKPVNRDA
jgi:hypothetical protein